MKIAELRHSAMCAVWSLRMAYAPSVEDEQMVRTRPTLFGDDGAQSFFHLLRRLPAGKPQAVGNAEHMRVHRNGVPAERDRIDDVRRLSAHPSKRAQLPERGGHFACVFFDDIARSGQDMRRLVVVKPARKKCNVPTAPAKE